MTCYADASALLKRSSRAAFATDLGSFSIVELDAATCELAATIAEQTGARTLDALHLGAARRLGTALTFLTFGVRRGQIARSLDADPASSAIPTHLAALESRRLSGNPATRC